MVDKSKLSAPAAPVATPTPAFSVGVRGVGIIDDNPSALAVYFNAAPNDDDIRALHEIVSGTPVAAQSSAPAIPPEKPLPDLMMASYHEAIGWNKCRKAVIAAQAHPDPRTPAQQPVSGADGLADSPTRGMNLGQRIAHVGGRENAQGYIEFGSPMAVDALIQHILRDMTISTPQGAFQARYRIPGGEWSSWGAVTCGVKGHEQELRYLATEAQPPGNSGELESVSDKLFTEAYQAGMDGDEFDVLRAKRLIARAALAQQDTDQTYKLVAEEHNRWIHAHAASKDFDDFLADEVARKEQE